VENRKNKKYYGMGKSTIKDTTWKSKFLMILPFLIITLILVVIPLILIFVKALLPTSGLSTGTVWAFMANAYIYKKILMSLLVAIIACIVCVLLAYPFCYFLSQARNPVYKSIMIFVATAPIWTSFLVKLVGLKTFFDLCYGFQNSTFGNVWTVIGLVYLYVPFMLAPLYTTMVNMPKNLINASYDLGRNGFQTFFLVVVPYTTTALISGITLVFLPSLVTVAVPTFLNNANDSSLIGDIIVEEGQNGNGNPVSLARASALCMIFMLILVVFYALFLVGKHIYLKKRGGNK